MINLKYINRQAQTIAQNYNPNKIILFGSYATGNPTLDSDVDLMIVIETSRRSKELGAEISANLKQSFPMDIVVKTPSEIKRRLQLGDFFLKDVMENGKVLYERVGQRMD